MPNKDHKNRDKEAQKSEEKAATAADTGSKKAHHESEAHAIKSIAHDVAAKARDVDNN